MGHTLPALRDLNERYAPVPLAAKAMSGNAFDKMATIHRQLLRQTTPEGLVYVRSAIVELKALLDDLQIELSDEH